MTGTVPPASSPAPSTTRPDLALGFGFSWRELQGAEGVERLHGRFLMYLEARDAAGAELLTEAQADPGSLGNKALSALVVRVAPHVGAFLGELFLVEDAVAERRERVVSDEPVFQFRKRFVKKRLARPKPDAEAASAVDRALVEAVVSAFAEASDVGEDEERAHACAALAVLEVHEVARKVAKAGGAVWSEALAERDRRLASLLEATGSVPEDAITRSEAALAALERVLRARLATTRDPARHWPSLRTVHRQDFAALVPLRRSAAARASEWVGAGARRNRVEPFALTDDRGSSREAAAQIDACLYCHEREKDSCSVGLRDKRGALTKNPLGIELAGCPLGEKIGEAQALRRAGEVLGALVAVAIDNPLSPGTGHRICNDCMKSCIFQKQAPVNVPHVETHILDDVLALPWGFEIWSLLTRFNPLRLRRPYPRAARGRDVLVVGLGPAGYTLAHYLHEEGFGVVAIDGLKIEPLPDAWLEGPIRDVEVLREPLERRAVLGFGGVSEYGITVRWDKSFLTMLYLDLLRRPRFRAYGGTRFGGALTLERAWELGFDHVAIAVGAGRPTLVQMKNGLARGVRQASDFLMALQLSGAFRRESLANLQVRLPAVVIGSGLTAIDTATEALAYYVVQCEKTLERYEALTANGGVDALRAGFDAEEREVLDEHLSHGRLLRAERERADAEGEAPDFGPLLDAWGGVRVVYRRRLVDSPAYRLNHEEVEKSLEEGVCYVELRSPLEAHVDAAGAVEAVTFAVNERLEDGTLKATGETERYPARAVFVAAGTKPNVTYEREFPGTFELGDWGYFDGHTATRGPDGTLSLERGGGFFTGYRGPADQTVSFYGDNHPRYAGSVVKAMASAKDGHVAVADLFDSEAARDDRFEALVARLDADLLARVHLVRRLAPSIVEVVVHAPAAARCFRPGQFFRLQSYERFAPRVDGTPLVMEGLALTGASTDVEAGLLSLIVLEMGASSKLCMHLSPGEPVVVMGPTGRPSEIAPDEDVLLVGGGLGNAVLFSIARAFREAGSRVLYFAGYRDSSLLFKREEIEAATDQVIWASDSGPPIEPAREQDAHFRGNLVEAMVAYARGELGERRVELGDVDRVLAIGSDGMMRAVGAARHGVLRPYLRPGHVALGSINSPMQCMMKEICAQCLQRHVDPETGEERLVYSCFDQDQRLDDVDFGFLKQRLRQSSAQEKLTDRWLGRLLEEREAAE